MSEVRRGLSRREAIAGAAGAAAGAGLYVVLRGGPDDADSAVLAPSCVLAPEQTEGPYYIDNHLIRADIRDGRRGVPLSLRLQVLDASSCKPIRGATVEVWHCDALGAYSGFNAAGKFCRGGLRTSSTGWVRFKTIYPGWYSGRTTHIHVKVHVGGSVVHTGQLYFADATSAAVYRSRAPYRSRSEGHAERAGRDLRRRRPAVDAATDEKRVGVRGAAGAGGAGVVQAWRSSAT